MVPPDEDILSLCPGDSVMEEFRSSEDNSESSNLLEIRSFEVLGPRGKAFLRTPRSSALRQSMLKFSEESFLDKFLPEGDLVSSCLSHIHGARSRSFSDDPSAGEIVPCYD